ncbi:MAG: C40 family peptidase [Acetatifactor sp.]
MELAEGFEIEVTEGNEIGAEAAEYALQFVGNPYAWGESSLTEGADCSGFTKSVFEHFGVEIPHDSTKQKDLGTEVSALEEAVPGDLVFYDTPAHVAIYIGNGMVVHALPQNGICVSDVNFDEVISIRRIVNAE